MSDPEKEPLVQEDQLEEDNEDEGVLESEGKKENLEPEPKGEKEKEVKELKVDVLVDLEAAPQNGTTPSKDATPHKKDKQENHEVKVKGNKPAKSKKISPLKTGDGEFIIDATTPPKELMEGGKEDEGAMESEGKKENVEPEPKGEKEKEVKEPKVDVLFDVEAAPRNGTTPSKDATPSKEEEQENHKVKAKVNKPAKSKKVSPLKTGDGEFIIDATTPPKELIEGGQEDKSPTKEVVNDDKSPMEDLSPIKAGQLVEEEMKTADSAAITPKEPLEDMAGKEDKKDEENGSPVSGPSHDLNPRRRRRSSLSANMAAKEAAVKAREESRRKSSSSESPEPMAEFTTTRKDTSEEEEPIDNSPRPLTRRDLDQELFVKTLAVPDLNEEDIYYFTFDHDYEDVVRNENRQIVESTQDPFLDPLPPLPEAPPGPKPTAEELRDPLFIPKDKVPVLAPEERNVSYRFKGSRFSYNMEDEEDDVKMIREHLKRPMFGLPCGKLPFGTPDIVDMRTFSSLNYMDNTCEYKKDHEQRLNARGERVRPSVGQMVFVAAVIGCVVGMLGFLLNQAIKWLSWYKYKWVAVCIEHMGDGTYNSFLTMMFLVMAINLAFCFLAATLGYKSPVSTGSGIPHIKTCLNGVKVPGLMHFKTLVAKFLGVIFSVVGGMPVGKEGPMIHTGAVIGAGLSQGKATTTWFKRFRGLDWFHKFQNDVTKREFVAVGSAAGVAAAFGAPIGGVLFVIEEGGSYLDAPMIFQTLIGACTSYFSLSICSTLVNGHTGDLSFKGLLSFGQYSEEDSQFSFIDLPMFVFLGLSCGLMGSLFNCINAAITQLRMRKLRMRWQKGAGVLMVSMLVTAAALTLMVTISDCKEITHNEENEHLVKMDCPEGQYHAGAAIWFATPESVIRDLLHAPIGRFTFKTLVFFAIVYYALAVITYGLPISSGLFIPCLLVGAAFGRIVGMFLHMNVPVEDLLGQKWGPLPLYALMGACGMLTGVVRISVCVCAILTEATGNHNSAFAILLTSIVAKIAADRFNEGIYEIHNDFSGVAYLNWMHTAGSEVLLTRNIMTFPVLCMERIECVSNVYHFICNYPCNGIPVVERRNHWSKPKETLTDGKLVGIVLKEDIMAMLALQMFEFYPDERRDNDPDLGARLREKSWKDIRAAYPHYFRIGDVSINPSIRERTFIDFSKILDPHPNTTDMSTTLDKIFWRFRKAGMRHLIVVDDDNHVKGMITRKDIYSFMSHNKALMYGSRTEQLGQKTRVIKSKNYWIVVRRY